MSDARGPEQLTRRSPPTHIDPKLNETRSANFLLPVDEEHYLRSDQRDAIDKAVTNTSFNAVDLQLVRDRKPDWVYKHVRYVHR